MTVGRWRRYVPDAPAPPDGDYIVWCCETAFYEAGFEEAKVVAGVWVFSSPRFFYEDADDGVVTHYAKPLPPKKGKAH